MDFHSMFEEMHAAMEEMMDVRRGIMDRMLGGFGPSVFPWFSSLREDFERDFQDNFAFPRFPRLLEQPTRTSVAAAPASVGPSATGAATFKAQPQPDQQRQERQQPRQQQQLQPAPVAQTSVMYSTQQCYNSADPSKNFSRHTTTQLGPGGVLESRTAVRDCKEGEDRIEVRRQLGDRYTHVTRKRRLDTGAETVDRRSHNLQDEELAPFEEEWARLAKQFLPMYRSEVPAGCQEVAPGVLKESPKSAEAEAEAEAGTAPGTLPKAKTPQTQAQAETQPTTVSLQK